MWVRAGMSVLGDTQARTNGRCRCCVCLRGSKNTLVRSIGGAKKSDNFAFGTVGLDGV